MRVVVTGARGFVGGATVRALEAAGHEVVAAVRSPAPDEDAARVVAFDPADVRGMATTFQGAHAVVHAAGSASLTAPESLLGWLEVAATENTLRAARHAGVSRFVTFSSTDVSLGTTPRKEWNEVRSVDQPISAFGRIERAKEDTVIGFGTSRFEPVVLRAGFVYGEGDRMRAPALVREAQRSGALRVVGRGLSFMPATYVGNLAHAAKLALESTRAAHGVYHVLDRELTSQQPFLARLSIALDLPLPRAGHSLLVERALAKLRGTSHPLDEAEILRRGLPTTLDGKRARLDLGYEPAFTQEEGMSALGAWVARLGGPDAVLANARPELTQASVDALRSAAEGPSKPGPSKKSGPTTRR